MITIPAVENVPVTLLRIDGKNPNKMDVEHFNALKKGMTTFGMIVPIITNNEFLIADGEHRLKAAKELGMTEVPVIKLPLTEVDRRILRQVLNKLRGEHDEDLDKDEYSFLQEAGGLETLQELLAMDASDYSGILDSLAPEPTGAEDDVPEVKESFVKKGEVWVLGNHKLLCGDATNHDDWQNLMGVERASMTFTDPPYGVSYADKNAYLNTIAPGNRIQTAIEGDHQTTDEMKALWDRSFKNLHTYLKEGGVYYITSAQGGNLMMMMMMSVLEAGLELKHVLIWVKNNHVLGRSDYNYKHEPILYGWKGTGHKFYADHDVSVWEHNKPHKSDLHPTMKPVELIEHALKNSSLQGEIILDPFGGSGSTLIACERTGRQCRMIELDTHYCSVIIKRWETLTNKKAAKQ